MRPRIVVIVVVAGIAAFAWAGGPKPDPALVRCGSDQVALFPDTTSKDGRFALGWTIRTRGKPAPAPWPTYDPDDPALRGRMALLLDASGAARHDDYTPVQGLVDLRARRFLPLPSDEPAFPGRARVDLSVRWDEPAGVARYGVIVDDHDGNSSQFTIDIWLVDLSGKRPHITSLKPAAERAIRGLLRARDPKDHARYEWRCALDRVSKTGRTPYDVFGGHALTLPFEADVPGEPQNVDAGLVQFALPGGAVRSCKPDDAARRLLRAR